MIAEIAQALREEAQSVNERRLLVLTGERQHAIQAIPGVLEAADIPRESVVLVGNEPDAGLEQVPLDQADSLLGTTQSAVIYDAHAGLEPNALARVVGSVDGGGLFLLLCPALEAWPAARDPFDETLAVPPADVTAVTGRYRAWFVNTLREHPGIAIVDVDSGRLEQDGRTHPPPVRPSPRRDVPAESSFPREAYKACQSADQARALSHFETLRSEKTALVMEADRGRGKSSVAGLAAACLATEGEEVVITAPLFHNAREGFRRARDLLAELGDLAGSPGALPREIHTGSGGSIRYQPPATAAGTTADVTIIDEAAGLSVSILQDWLAVERVAFTTTIHGYEGAGRGFSIRFQAHLDESDLTVTRVSLTEPIRYAAGDPIEVWSFRAFLLNATPVNRQLIADARPRSVDYRPLEPEALLSNEPRLREAFGLLVLSHYRTEPNDLARLLDAPNIQLRALLHDDHIVSIAMLAREGGLAPSIRAKMYDGHRIRGNMLPDVLTSQLHDEKAAAPVGQRIMRIATHAAVRSTGLGSRLVANIRDEFGRDMDWLGVSYGATPDLIDFWAKNDFIPVHLSNTRNARSGEHSVLMLSPTSPAGRSLQARHTDRFISRLPGVLADSLTELDPEIVRTTLRATARSIDLDLSARAWRHIARTAYGPGLYSIDPDPFRQLAVKHLVDPLDPTALSTRQEQLIVTKALQTRPVDQVVDEFGYPSRRQCMRALSDAYQPLVDLYGSPAARDERDRFRD